MVTGRLLSAWGGIAAPLLVMLLLGRLDLTVYVIFGALTGVFGGRSPTGCGSGTWPPQGC